MGHKAVRVALAALAIALTSCGGGGGGSGDNTSDGGTVGNGGDVNGGGATTTGTGLVPAAPALGATVYSDALTLRPVRTGARWEYRGMSTAFAGASPVHYLTATSQSDVTAAGASEFTSNSGNDGNDTATVSLSGGQVRTPTSTDLTGKGTPQSIDFIELRSPVRLGDQYTTLDQHYSDTAIDADGDGKPDALDVAIYARVVTAETLTLPNLPVLDAVRVDTFVVSRLTLSSTGRFSPAVQAQVQTWYVAGVGIVRQITAVPTLSGEDVATTDEVLSSWDGVTSGLGPMAPVVAGLPTDNSNEMFAFAFDDHALLFISTPGPVPSTQASRIDLRGKVLGSTLISGLGMSSNGVAAAQANGVVYLEPLGGGGVKAFGLTRFDNRGELVGVVRGVTLDLGGAHVSSVVERFAAAAEGSTLWVLWSRPYYDPGPGNVPGTELILQPFALDGTPLGAEVLVEPAFSGGNLAVAASEGQVLITWTRGAPRYDVMFGASALGQSVAVGTLASGLLSSNSFVTPLRLGSDGALLWPGTLGGGGPVDLTSGVVLLGDLMPLRAGPTLLDEKIMDVPPYSTLRPTSRESRIVITSTRSAMLWPEDVNPQEVDYVNWLDTGNVSLAYTPVASVRMASSNAKAQAVFADRVLVFGNRDKLTTTVVWLNKGGTQ